MKVRILATLLALSLIWAIVATFFYWRLRVNPRVVAVTMNAEREGQQQQQIGEVEKISFLRQFLDRYFTYDSNNFWQTQTSLAFLMTPSLAAQRLAEINRLRDKIQEKNLVHVGQVLVLKLNSRSEYEATLHLQTQEASNSSKMNLFLKTHLSLEATERTIENPWGLVVHNMSFSETTAQEPTFDKNIRMVPHRPTLLVFPCPIKDIKNPVGTDLTMKITTLNVSELQLFANQIFTSPTTLLALCDKQEFEFNIVFDEGDSHLYVQFPQTAGAPRKTDLGSQKKKTKDIYDKTIEDVLGIKLDQ